jgi:hypothetical protein
MLYWENKGKYQDLYNLLTKQIPVTGECPKNRPALEKLRKAANCYYDLYNNGLSNRAREFYKVFGFSGKPIVNLGPNSSVLQDQLDAKFDEIVLEAACEAKKLKILNIIGIE